MTRFQCNASVHDTYGVGHHRCSRHALVGKKQCRIHTPEYLKEKTAKLDAKWAAQYKVKVEGWTRLPRAVKLLKRVQKGLSLKLVADIDKFLKEVKK